MTPAGRWRADIAALGRAAPRRVAQEAALRSGWSGRAFVRRSEAAAEAPAPEIRTILRPPAAPPADAVERAGAAAEQLLGGSTVVFGRTLPVDSQLRPGGSWHRCPDTGAQWPAERRWWRIDLRGPKRIGDVKWVWEAARHRDLVTLARVAAADGSPGSAAAASGLAAALSGWQQEVQPERGVHWLSNLELGLRALAWLQVLALAGPALPPAVRRRTASDLLRTRAHLDLGLTRTQTSMANNHLIGDLVALSVLERSLSPAPPGRYDDLLVRQVEVEVRPDGSMIEESVSYHRFVLELLALRAAAGSAPQPVTDALGRGARWLCRLGALDGTVPQFGDWDEGRAVVSSHDVHDLGGTTRLGLALAGGGAPPEWRAAYDEVAWHVGAGDPTPPEAAETDGGDVGGGFSRAQRGAWTVWLKASGGGWHGHADHTAVVIRRGAVTVVGDPGTGSYNGPLEQRQHHRSSVSHDVRRVDGLDQLEPHRQFRWRRSATSRTGAPVAYAGGVASWAAHDAYRRDGSGPWVLRVVWCSPDGVTVADWTTTPAPWALSVPLHPSVQRSDGALTLADGAAVAIRLPGQPAVHCGEHDPYDGWWSPTYGEVQPAERLEVAGPASPLPAVWAVSEVDAPAAAVRDDGAVEIGAVLLRVQTGAEGARLEVGPTSGGAARSAALRW